ncbi:TKL protein kinase [Fonticula alba]|uniref:TKL protein kinase n=1 Tax=Fonticula alba TaxID=691883 RepID=A0A058Z6C3_FONAL|nr:TKL protein kinase [Fonticula alba]KCV69820.1 TKL protein kinase [Fonticula alba]|eukprot:XP_009495426.1 TKL protein kinase [Fonticula alba]
MSGPARGPLRVPALLLAVVVLAAAAVLALALGPAPATALSLPPGARAGGPAGPAEGISTMSCAPNCANCSGLICNFCNTGFYQIKNELDNPCVSQCPGHLPAILLEVLTEYCVFPQVDGCSYMVGSMSTCTACVAGRVLSEQGGACLHCPANCQICPDVSSCSQCFGGFLFHQGTCVAQCPGGFFPNGGSCSACPGPCATCSNSSTCGSCHGGYFLHGGACTADCPAGTFPNAASGACDMCPASCATCTGPSTCGSCQGGYFLSEGRCVAQCPSGTFAHAESRTCVGCPANCTTCTGANVCTSCAGGFNLHGTSCLSQCPSGFFARGGICTACGHHCATCPDDTTCTACAPGYPLHQGACMGQGCPDGYFDRDNACAACNVGCATCIEASTCGTCASALVLYQGQCLAGCPAGTYAGVGPGDAPQGICLACHPLCAACAGPGADQCTACDDPLTIRQPIPPVDPPLAEGMCVPDCMNDPSQCVECEPGCDLCRRMPDASTFCMVCHSPGLALDGLCVGACPPGYATMTAAGYCARCSGNCGDACFGPGSNQCLACPAGKRLQDGTCRDACSTVGWFESSPGACSRCHASCSQCVGPGPGDCTACPRGSFRMASPGGLAHQCVTACPAGQYADVLHGECRACDASCATCSGGSSASDCTGCWPGELLFHTTCVASCPVGYYPTASGAQCGPCGSGCVECAPGTGVCTVCAPGQYADYAAGMCYTVCPGRFLADDRAMTCTPCAEPCARCAASIDHCVRCQDPGHYLRVATGECVVGCQAGEVAIMGTGTQAGMLLCAACHESCESCNAPGSASACSSCPAGSFLSPGGACLAECPIGYFVQEMTRRCDACHGSCHTCAGASIDQCLSCTGSADILLRGACVSSCSAEGFWLDESTPSQRVCHPCIPGCRLCSEAEACSRCNSNMVLHHSEAEGTACLGACPGGFFADPPGGERQPVCAACAPDCHTCTGPGAHECQVPWCEVDGSCNPKSGRALAIGLAVGLSLVLLLLLAILLVVFCVFRRRHAGPKEAHDIDMTILNTMMDLSLPGFLLLSFQHDIRLGNAGPEATGSQGGIFPAEPIKPSLIAATGPDGIVVKVAHDADGGALSKAQLQAMFENELSILWALQQSPHVVRMLGYTQHPPAIVMARVATDLSNLLTTNEPLDVANTLSLIRGMADGLAFIHAQGIAHRDIKSQNILVGLCPETGAMRPVFTDFGVSLAVSRGSALLDSVMFAACSIAFAAPEILASMGNHALDIAAFDHMAADVYSLGSVFWHVLTLTMPWSGLSQKAIQCRHAAGDTPATHGPPPGEAPNQHPSLRVLVSDLIPCMWSASPASRPSMSSIALALSE